MHFAHDKKPGSSPDPPKSGPGVPESGPPLARGKHIFVGGVDRFVPGPRRASYSDACYQNNTYGMFTQLVVYAQSPLKLGLCRDVISLTGCARVLSDQPMWSPRLRLCTVPVQTGPVHTCYQSENSRDRATGVIAATTIRALSQPHPPKIFTKLY